MASIAAIAIKRANALEQIEINAARIGALLGVEPPILPNVARKSTDREFIFASQLEVMGQFLEEIAFKLQAPAVDSGAVVYVDGKAVKAATALDKLISGEWVASEMTPGSFSITGQLPEPGEEGLNVTLTVEPEAAQASAASETDPIPDGEPKPEDGAEDQSPAPEKIEFGTVVQPESAVESDENAPDFELLTVLQLRDYAESHNIDISQANRKAEIVATIKAAFGL